MAWTLTSDVEKFRARAGGFLRADPVRNTVALTVIEAMRKQGPALYEGALFGWWPRDGRVAATVLWAGANPPMLSAMPDGAARDLADALAARGATVRGANGAPRAAEVFAGAWTARTGTASRVVMRQRLYRLGKLEAPDPAPGGAARVAGDADRDLVLDWFAAFHRDVGEHGEVNTAMVDGRLRAGGVLLWEAGGRPVAMAGRTPAVGGMARVAPVYTPAGHRRRGYGAAVTAAATRDAQDAGAADVVLFTDLGNPTSNSVYRRLGYRPVEDRVVLAFT
ncbi:GNAT family N-acetyltransferase [Actinomadura madurae]|uniref:GNAT family N-acetyltransferase n=1 Tax=Actinomadura madurae TaxID=1993 RepID=UPI002026A26D|nr:GNAT family N-acetyltransferase [Actinomadura madurae]URN00528.1 GNAT family N-acetyltransferase [Actinomadura madurae]